ncbi:MAG: hypothetical protein GY794_03810 [bacterium]|nr:hypothetical protein [bacterium]
MSNRRRHVGVYRLNLMVAISLIAVAATLTLRDADKLEAGVRAKLTGVFMGWGVGRNGTKQCVSIKFIPKGRSTKATMNAPCITPNAQGVVSHSPSYRVAKSLKIGEKIEIEYSSVARRVWLSSLRRAGASPEQKDSTDSAKSPQTPIDKFVFVGAKKVRTSAGLKMKIVVRRGSNMWSFPAPFEPANPTDADSDEDSDAKSDKPKKLSQQVSIFKGGDIVALKYDTDTSNVQFKFLVTGISPYKMYITGKVTRLGTRIMRGKKHEMVYMKAGKTKHVLVIPLVDEDGSKENAKQLSETLKSLGESEVRFTYRKVGGIKWLVHVVAKPSTS